MRDGNCNKFNADSGSGNFDELKKDKAEKAAAGMPVQPAGDAAEDAVEDKEAKLVEGSGDKCEEPGKEAKKEAEAEEETEKAEKEAGEEAEGADADKIELAKEEKLQRELEDVRRQLEEQTSLAQEYFNRLARMKADFENLRRRSQREKEEFVRYASEQLIKSLLPVLDNFERALADESGELEKFKDGVRMIYTQLQEILSGEGLAPIPAEGEEFDPEKHEAVISEESAKYPENMVLEELRKGYTFKGKVIRPTMVKVAKSS